MRKLLIFLLGLALFARAEDTNTEAVCRTHLKRLGSATRAYRLIHDGKPPAKLSDLYLDGLVESLGEFACPASSVTIVTAPDIDAKTDYTFEALPAVTNLVVREKRPRHETNKVLVALADGTIKPLAIGITETGGGTPAVAQPTPAASIHRAGQEGVSAAAAITNAAPALVVPPLFGVDPPEFTRAHELYAAKRLADALPLYDAALRKSPGHTQALRERAVIRLWLNQVRGSLSDWTALARQDPKNIEARRMRAALELIAGDPRAGMTEAEELLSRFPPDGQSYLLHGQACLWNNNPAGAKASITRSLELDPDIPTHLSAQAAQFLEWRVPAMALLHYSGVQLMNPNYPDPYYGIGMACSQLGQTNRAVEALKKYLEFESRGPHAQQARAELKRLNR